MIPIQDLDFLESTYLNKRICTVVVHIKEPCFMIGNLDRVQHSVNGRQFDDFLYGQAKVQHAIEDTIDPLVNNKKRY